jgi:hypothetical protein
MHSRIRIYNRAGVPIGEISATTKRSWLLNNYGECTFVIGKRSPKLQESLIEFGNFVLVTNQYTKPWVGVIDTPRAWTKNGPRITAYSAEILLSYRDGLSVNSSNNMLNDQIKLTGKAGTIFRQLVNIGNEHEDMLVRIGSIYADGADRQETLSVDFLSHARNVAGRSGNDFDVLPWLQENNTLLFTANWYAKKDKAANVTLEEGVNIEVKEEGLIEQGVIVNSITGVGVAEMDMPSLGIFYEEAASVAKYGKRQSSTTYGTVSEVATLTENVKNYAQRNAYPRATANVTCVKSAMYTSISEGDTVRLRLHSSGFLPNKELGFDKNVRVLGMQANDDKNTLDLVLDEIAGGA